MYNGLIPSLLYQTKGKNTLIYKGLKLLLYIDVFHKYGYGIIRQWLQITLHMVMNARMIMYNYCTTANSFQWVAQTKLSGCH